MKKNILTVVPLNDKHKEYLKSCAPDCTFTFSSYDTVTQEQVDAAEIILGNASTALVKNASNLRWIQLNSAGYDDYVIPGILKAEVKLTCATGAYGLTVSDAMVTDTLMLCRKMDLYMKNQSEHVWKAEGSVTSPWNSVVLVLGLGDIGREYARKMHALGSYIIGVRRNIADRPDYVDEMHTLDEIDSLLPRADIVAMILPSTAETRKLMDARRLGLMKKGSYLINAGRGDAVDCDALNEALRCGDTLAGCALDVTDPEPLPKDHPLWDAPRAIITPHVAGFFYLEETLNRIVKIMGGNLKAYLEGREEEMRNVIRR